MSEPKRQAPDIRAAEASQSCVRFKMAAGLKQQD